jgi:hypothetical protein
MINHRSRAICSRARRVCLAIFEMADINEQRINITFCFKLEKTFTKTHEMIKNVYSDQRMSRTHCYEWFKRFKDGRQSTYVDEPRLGRPSTSCDDSHVAQVSEIVLSNSRLTVREIAEECKTSLGSCRDILTTKSEMHQVVSKFVPRLLSDTGSETQSRCHL